MSDRDRTRRQLAILTDATRSCGESIRQLGAMSIVAADRHAELAAAEEHTMTEPQRATIAVPSILKLACAAAIALAVGLVGNVFQFTGDIRPFQVIGMCILFVVFLVL